MNRNRNNDTNIDMQQYKSVRYIIPFFVANTLIYGLNALYYTFIPIYLEQVCSFDEFQRGIILSIGPLVAIPALLFFGIMSDKAKYKKNILALIIIASAVLFYAISFNTSFLYLAVIFAVMMFFFSPFGSLIDSISLEYTVSAQVKYGPIRTMGSLAFGVLSLTLTFLTQVNINIIFVSFIIMAIISVISTKLMPPIQGHAREPKQISLKSFKEFFSDKTVVALFICLLIGQFSYGAYNNFMPNFIISELKLPQWVWGLNVLLTILGELVFFVKFDFFFRRFTLKQILMFSIFTQVIRYLSFWLISDGVGILITSLITGSFCTVINYVAAYYINMTAKKEFRTSAQTLLYAISFYVARFLSAFAGGIISNKFGFGILMMCCAILNILLLIYAKFAQVKQIDQVEQ